MKIKNSILAIIILAFLGCSVEESDSAKVDHIASNDFELTTVDDLNKKIVRLEQRLFSDVNFSIEMKVDDETTETNQWANYFSDSSLVKVQKCNFEDVNPWRYEFYFDGINNPIALVVEGVEGEACWFNNSVIYRQSFYFEEGNIIDNVIDMPSEKNFSFSEEFASQVLVELQSRLG